MGLYEDIKKGLKEAIDYENGKLDNVKISIRQKNVEPLDTFSPKEIKEIRCNTNMTQGLFAKGIGVSKKTIEAWEGGRSTPDGASRRLLSLISKDPFFLQEYGIVTYTD